MDNAFQKKIINLVNCSEIASIQGTVTEVLRLIKDENSGAKDIKRVIEKDPPLCARLIRMANSAHFGGSNAISDVQNAIIRVGFDTVKELVLTQKVCNLFQDEDAFEGYSRRSLWQHSAAVALCCKLIYRRVFKERGAEIYVAGLLHDIGIIIEDQFFPDLFLKTLKALKGSNKNLFAIENEIMGFNHSLIGSIIAREWGFPEELVQAISFHHQIKKVKPENERLVHTIFLANYLCQREKVGFVEGALTSLEEINIVTVPMGIDEETLEVLVDELKEELSALEELGWFSK